MDKPWKVDGLTDAELAEAYFNSWQSANKEVCRLETLIAEKDREIERMSGQFAKGFAAGKDCTLRRNPSGCCCKFSEVGDEDEIVRLCEAHKDYLMKMTEEKDREIERLKEDVARYKKVRQLNVNEFHNLFVKSISDNRSFDTLVDELDNINAERIDDGFGCTWSKTCPNCGGKSMEIVRPGKAQCSICG